MSLSEGGVKRVYCARREPFPLVTRRRHQMKQRAAVTPPSSVTLGEKGIVIRQRRLSVRHAFDRRERINEKERFGAFLGELLDAPLQVCDFLRVAVGEIGFLRRVLRNVVKLGR